MVIYFYNSKGIFIMFVKVAFIWKKIATKTYHLEMIIKICKLICIAIGSEIRNYCRGSLCNYFSSFCHLLYS